jgi:hypothetical protein
VLKVDIQGYEPSKNLWAMEKGNQSLPTNLSPYDSRERCLQSIQVSLLLSVLDDTA